MGEFTRKRWRKFRRMGYQRLKIWDGFDANRHGMNCENWVINQSKSESNQEFAAFTLSRPTRSLKMWSWADGSKTWHHFIITGGTRSLADPWNEWLINRMSQKCRPQWERAGTGLCPNKCEKFCSSWFAAPNRFIYDGRVVGGGWRTRHGPVSRTGIYKCIISIIAPLPRDFLGQSLNLCARVQANPFVRSSSLVQPLAFGSSDGRSLVRVVVF